MSLRRSLLLVTVLAGVLAAGCGGGGGAGQPKAAISPPTTTGAPVTTRAQARHKAASARHKAASQAASQAASTVLAAGDVAACDESGDEQTAALLARLPGTVLGLGDMAYDDGTPSQFQQCYAPSWGRYRARTRPAPGNHDYHDQGASGYYDYFGAAAGPRGKGWYSFDLGGWHLIALNSNCDDIGGCATGSEQERWLRADLAAHPARCTLAFWHHPRYSSGTKHGSQTFMAPIWSALYDGGADLVLSGHEHNYERFAPMDARGNLDNARGIREFVVGTGGRGPRNFGSIKANSVARHTGILGVLSMTLHDGSYDWQFIREDGYAADSGRGECH